MVDTDVATAHTRSLMFDAILLHDTRIAPALFLAPMAGVTHSAFRRLVSDFGGYGALTTEMVSASAFLVERSLESPFTKRRECEGHLICQLRVSGAENLEAVFAKLAGMPFSAIDLNLGCPAPKIQHQASGAALFRDFTRLQDVLTRIRRVYAGALTVKCRLGDDPDHWREPFTERLRLFENHDIAAITVHPRFSTEKLKRRVRWHEFPWIASRTTIPIIGNGDIHSRQDIEDHREAFSAVAGLMLGRVVATKPWIFRDFAGLPRMDIDHAEVWDRLYRYVMEDFQPERAFGRLKEFTAYFAENFFFGHQLFCDIQKATDAASVRAAALSFLEKRPKLRQDA